MNFCVLISRSDIAEQSGDVSQSVSGPTFMRFFFFFFFSFFFGLACVCCISIRMQLSWSYALLAYEIDSITVPGETVAILSFMWREV